MCIRFEQYTGDLIKWSWEIGAWVPEADWVQGADTFPGYKAPIILPSFYHGRALIRASWGMQPWWAKTPNWGRKNAYNARSETLLEKPTFRNAFKSRRCIVPAGCFYERMNGRWVRFRCPEDHGTLAIAALYEMPNKLAELPTFALVTSDPNETVAEIHDRMPVVLSLGDVERWLDPEAEPGELRAMLQPFPADWLITEDGGPIETRKKKGEPAALPEGP